MDFTDFINTQKIMKEQIQDLQNQVKRMQCKENHTIVDKSFSTHWVSYTQSSTCHGISYVFHQSHGSIRKFLWLVVYLTCVSVYVYFSSTAVMRYFTYPTSSNIQYIYAQDMEFPAMTICSRVPVKTSYYDELVANGSLPAFKSVMDYVRQQVAFGNMDLVINDDLTDMTDTDLIRKIGEDHYEDIKEALDNATRHIDWEYHFMTGGLLHTDIISAVGEICAVTWPVYTFVSCRVRRYIYPTTYPLSCNEIVFHTDNTILRSNATYQSVYMMFNTKLDTMQDNLLITLFHQPHEIPLLNDLYTINSQAMNIFVLERTDVVSLPSPHGTCKDTQADGFISPLEHYQNYSRQACLVECQGNVYKEQCGCTPIGNPIRDGIPACKGDWDFDMIGCAKEVSTEGKCLKCVEACNTMKYRAQKQEDTSDSDVGLWLTFKEQAYTEMKQSAVYTPDSLFGEIGGQMGLFIGASILSVVELLDLAVLTVLRCFNREKKQEIPST